MVYDGSTTRPQHPADFANVGVDVGGCDVHEDVKRPHSVHAVAADRGEAPAIGDVKFHVSGVLEPAAADFDASVRKVDQDEVAGERLKGLGPTAARRRSEEHTSELQSHHD